MKTLFILFLFASPAFSCDYCRNAGKNLPTTGPTGPANYDGASGGKGSSIMKVVPPKSALDDGFFKGQPAEEPPQTSEKRERENFVVSGGYQ